MSTRILKPVPCRSCTTSIKKLRSTRKNPLIGSLNSQWHTASLIFLPRLLSKTLLDENSPILPPSALRVPTATSTRGSVDIGLPCPVDAITDSSDKLPLVNTINDHVAAEFYKREDYAWYYKHKTIRSVCRCSKRCGVR